MCNMLILTGSCSHGNSTNAEGYVQMTSSCLYKYRKPQGEVTWQEAHDLCLANQSELARFQNKLNYSTVELLNLLAETSAWIGLTKKWQWLDGKWKKNKALFSQEGISHRLASLILN